jgi:hypothetical protein
MNPPSGELAARITREVRWNERIEGALFGPGPGEMVERLFRLEDVYKLLSGLPNFQIDFHELKNWIRGVIGDQELADAMDTVLSVSGNPRQETVLLLGHRLQQCIRVLNQMQAPERESQETTTRD